MMSPSLIVDDDYPFISSDCIIAVIFWIAEGDIARYGASGFYVGCRVIDELDWFSNFQCAVAESVIREVIREERTSG